MKINFNNSFEINLFLGLKFCLSISDIVLNKQESIVLAYFEILVY